MTTQTTLTHHEVLEFARCAQAMYGRGANDAGHLLSGVAAMRVVSPARYDAASAIYRAWLVFNTIPQEA